MPLKKQDDSHLAARSRCRAQTKSPLLAAAVAAAAGAGPVIPNISHHCLKTARLFAQVGMVHLCGLHGRLSTKEPGNLLAGIHPSELEIHALAGLQALVASEQDCIWLFEWYHPRAL